MLSAYWRILLSFGNMLSSFLAVDIPINSAYTLHINVGDYIIMTSMFWIYLWIADHFLNGGNQK